jgi:hypothetical protein
MNRDLQDYHAVTRTDVPKAAPWLEDAVKPINSQLTAITDHLQYRDEEEVELQAVHGQAYDVELQTLQGDPRGGWLLYSAAPVERMDLEITGTRNVRITFLFVGAPTTEKLVRILIRGN